jgi:hypothetical protein
MLQDPIVEELHRIREQLAAKFDFDIAAIFADMRTRQTLVGDRLVTLDRHSGAIVRVETNTLETQQLMNAG